MRNKQKMNLKTIKKLNKINSDFYKAIADEFSETRHYHWKGWDNLVSFLKISSLQVLDMGCGNGRFGQFLINKKFSDFLYCGVDNSNELLKIAKNNLKNVENARFENIDIVESLLNNSLEEKLPSEKYDLITLFGVLHHIPSFELRKKLIEELSLKLKKNGLLVLTSWQFPMEDRFNKKIIKPEKLNLKPTELYKNDYILDWKKGKTAYRYCHFTDDSEINEIMENIENISLFDEFLADGSNNKLNRYFILKKNK